MSNLTETVIGTHQWAVRQIGQLGTNANMQAAINAQMQNAIPTQPPNQYAQQMQGFQPQQAINASASHYQSLSSIQNGFLPDLRKTESSDQTPAIAYNLDMPEENSVDYFRINRMIANGDFSTV